MFTTRHWPWLTLYLVLVFGALVAGGLKHLELQDDLAYARWETRQAVESATRCWNMHLKNYALDDGLSAMREDIVRDQEARARDLAAGDVTAVRAGEGFSAGAPEPSQAELAARDWQISLRWDPLRRCVLGVPATRWLTRIDDGALEWPAGIGCGP